MSKRGEFEMMMKVLEVINGRRLKVTQIMLETKVSGVRVRQNLDLFTQKKLIEKLPPNPTWHKLGKREYDYTFVLTEAGREIVNLWRQLTMRIYYS